jgi:F-type H+-transporting ATPase subunit delta
MNSIASTIKALELSTFIQNPTKVEVENALLEVFANTNKVTKIFHLLFENKIEILEAIALEYNNLFDIMNGVEAKLLLLFHGCGLEAGFS